MMKKRQHYVWEHYLKAWTIRGHITTLHDGRLRQSATDKVAVVRYLYRIRGLTDADMEVLFLFADKAMGSRGKQFQRERVQLIQRLRLDRQRVEEGAPRLLEEGLIDEKMLDAARLELDEKECNLQEDFHMYLETDFAEELAALHSEDRTWLDDPHTFACFAQYLSAQMMRTKKARDLFLASVATWRSANHPEFSGNRVWPVLSWMAALNLGASYIDGRPRHHTLLLRAALGTEFITSDCPVINEPRVAEDPLEQVDIFYPLSPRLALRFGFGDHREKCGTQMLTPDEVLACNRLIFSRSHEQVFATSPTPLLPFMGEASRPATNVARTPTATSG